MEQEIFYFIEKLDINEEIVRLKSNLKYFEKIMNEKSPNGKNSLLFLKKLVEKLIPWAQNLMMKNFKKLLWK